jgi:hypothetical protein
LIFIAKYIEKNQMERRVTSDIAELLKKRRIRATVDEWLSSLASL